MSADDVAVVPSDPAPPPLPPAVSTPRPCEPTNTTEVSTERPKPRKETEQSLNVVQTETETTITATTETLQPEPQLFPPSDGSTEVALFSSEQEIPAHGEYGPVRPYEIDVLGYSGAALLLFNGLMTGFFRKGYMSEAGLLPSNNDNHPSRTRVTHPHRGVCVSRRIALIPSTVCVGQVASLFGRHIDNLGLRKTR